MFQKIADKPQRLNTVKRQQKALPPFWTFRKS